MKVPLPPRSPALPIHAVRLSLFPVSAAAATTPAVPDSPIGVPTPQPVIRLLSGLLLLCSAASARAALDPSPWQLDFQEHALFTTSAPMATTLSNTGNQSLTVVDVSPATGVYARAGGSCGAVPFTIAAQASCTIEHTFTPDALAVFYQTITTTLASGDHVAFGLAGEGAQGHLTIDPLFGLDWSSTPVGAIGVEKIAILANDGPVPMQITEIVTSSVPAVSAFVRTGGNCPEPPINFGDGGSCTLAYTFVPAQVGESTTDLDFRGGGSAYSLSLSGEGSPEIPLFEDGFEATAPAPMQ